MYSLIKSLHVHFAKVSFLLFDFHCQFRHRFKMCAVPELL